MAEESMEAIINRQNQPFLVYSQGPALYLLPLPLISPVRPRMIARDCQRGLNCSALEAELIFLYENTDGQIVLLFHNPETGQQRYLPLLSQSPEESYQDFFLWQAQGRLYFFYTAYMPSDGRCRLLYKLPLEHLESRPAMELETGLDTIATDCSAVQCGTIKTISTPNAPAVNDADQKVQEPLPPEEDGSRPAAESSQVKNVLEENQRQARELEATIEHISAQYQELYDYTLALQKEARKWRDLAQNGTCQPASQPVQ